MDEYNTLKVSDFGLSQEIYGRSYFRQVEGEETKLPIKWMALESMTDGMFSEKTDVVREKGRERETEREREREDRDRETERQRERER